jgi:SAM-dependent methyltransferase
LIQHHPTGSAQVSTGPFESPFPLSGAQKRYQDWLAALKAKSLFATEMLLPQLAVPCPRTLPALMTRGDHMAGADPQHLRQRIAQLKPWGYGIQLMQGVQTEPTTIAMDRMIYRSHLISGAVRQLLGDQLTDCTFIDFACNHGYFTLEMAHSGAKKAVGVDLRAENVAKAQFLNSHFQLPNAEFRQQDIYTLDEAEPFDVVFNLGVLYHITDPYRLVKMSYDLCKRFAVIDSIMHKEPVSAHIQRVNKDSSKHAEGKFDVELHPTYRAVIDLMHAVGFKQVIEVVRAPSPDGNDCPHELYDRYDRRCLIGFKEPVDLPDLYWPEAPADPLLAAAPRPVAKKSQLKQAWLRWKKR